MTFRTWQDSSRMLIFDVDAGTLSYLPVPFFAYSIGNTSGPLYLDFHQGRPGH